MKVVFIFCDEVVRIKKFDAQYHLRRVQCTKVFKARGSGSTSPALGPCHIENNNKFRLFVHNCKGLLRESCKRMDPIVETSAEAKLFQQQKQELEINYRTENVRCDY